LTDAPAEVFKAI